MVHYIRRKKRKMKKDNKTTFEDFLKYLNNKKYFKIVNKKNSYKTPNSNITKWTSQDKEEPISFTNLGVGP